MEWFNGGVANAIAACRQQKALFIVYIHGEENTQDSFFAPCSSFPLLGLLCRSASSESTYIIASAFASLWHSNSGVNNGASWILRLEQVLIGRRLYFSFA